jgi:hypothetical protein
MLLIAQSRAFCDVCMARALGIEPSTAYRAAVKITGTAVHRGIQRVLRVRKESSHHARFALIGNA